MRFSADRAEFQRSVRGIETVARRDRRADEDVELRRLTVTNRSKRSPPARAHQLSSWRWRRTRGTPSHPAFAKMFVETERLDGDVLIAWRRPREPGRSAHLDRPSYCWRQRRHSP